MYTVSLSLFDVLITLTAKTEKRLMTYFNMQKLLTRTWK